MALRPGCPHRGLVSRPRVRSDVRNQPVRVSRAMTSQRCCPAATAWLTRKEQALVCGRANTALGCSSHACETDVLIGSWCSVKTIAFLDRCRAA